MTRGADVTRRLIQWIKMLVAVVIGVGLVYRAHTYCDTHEPGILVPVMCVLTAVSLVGTAMVTIFSKDIQAA